MPVYNEERDIPRNIPVLYRYLTANLSRYRWKLIIADNGPSKDRTAQISKKLTQRYKNLRYVCIPKPGRGGALRAVWLKEKSSFLCYMDVDLSSDLSFLSELVSALEQGADVVIGSRLKKGSRVYGRTILREIMSRGYNILIRLLFWTSFHDAQCGFKAVRREVARVLLPKIKDTAWFFDSELLIIAEKSGFKVKEIPIVWRDDPASTVKIAKTAWGDIKGLIRLFWTRPWRKVTRNK